MAGGEERAKTGGTRAGMERVSRNAGGTDVRSVPRQATRRLVARARARRASPTPSEQLLWETLRDRRFCGFRFRRSCVVLGRLVGFWCPGAALALEVGDVTRTELVLASRGVVFYRLPAVTPETLPAALVPIKRALAGCPSPRTHRHAAREPPKVVRPPDRNEHTELHRSAPAMTTTTRSSRDEEQRHATPIDRRSRCTRSTR
jgi:hypothetical protein